MTKNFNDAQRPPPTRGQCHFYVERKLRYCKMMVKSGSDYCGEHGSERVPCPLDPKHFVTASDLENHLQKCNARVFTGQLYHKLDINSGEDMPPAGSDCQESSIADVPKDKVLQFIAKLRAIITTFSDSIMDESTASIDNNAEEGGESRKARKHGPQISSIISLLQSTAADLKSEPMCLMEFGAGRAELSCHLAPHVHPGSRIVLIDRANARRKFDAGIAAVVPDVDRIKMDIKDFDAGAYRDTCPHQSSAVYSKHLCGAATDLTLRCVAAGNLRPRGFVIALCCHHRCTFGAYINRAFLARLGIRDAEEFRILTALSSWATCSRKPGHEEPSAYYDGLAFAEREQIGRDCKLLLDLGRLQFLRDIGYDARLCYYVHRDVTLENVALVARAQ